MTTVIFVKEQSEKMFSNEFTGRSNSYRYIAMMNNKKGCLPGEVKPYSPVGGIKALKEVLNILIWL